MQRFILKKKNQLALVSIILIVMAFISKYALQQVIFFNIFLIIAGILGVIPIALQAYQSLRVKVISIDVLVTISVIGAFVIKNYEEAAIVTFLFLLGAFLEQKTLNKTRSAIKELTKMTPDSALKKMDSGEFEEVDVEDVLVGDTLLVRTGAKVPVDGVVVSGDGYINESSITGESVQVNKEIGMKVFAGTILENGTIYIKAEKVGEDTTFGKIIELVEEAQDSKSNTERFVDTFSKYYTPIVLVLGLLVGLIWQDIALAITILVLGCPGALVIGVPVSNVAGIGNGARNGVLLKGSEVINDFSKVDTMVFDKTGTLTVGNPEVAEVKFYTENKKEKDIILDYLLVVESESDHPLAKSVVKYINKEKVYTVGKTQVIKGGGIIANVDNKNVLVGNISLMKQQNIVISDEILNYITDLENNGNSIVITAVDGVIKVVMGVKDKIRPDVITNLKKLKKQGVENLIILSGDNQGTVDLVAKELGMTEAFGNMLPEDKSTYIAKLQKGGHVVAFVGDGVNDSPSLALANIGIAMGNGTDVAIETSDVVLMNSNFNKLSHALGLAKVTSRNMKQNIFIALSVVAVLFASVLMSDWMNMSIGMLVHEVSILAVILNGMRLLKYKSSKKSKQKISKDNKTLVE